jgi:excisionase family DNA binding protein
VGEDRTEGAQQSKEYVSVGEAAKLLGVHRNTIHNRIKSGRIRAHKVLEADREVYRIERDSLGDVRTGADVHTLDAQRTTVSEELARMIATRWDEIVRTSWAASGRSLAQSGPAARWRRPRSARGWRKSGAGGKRPNGNATTCAENCTASESCQELLRCPGRGHRVQSSGPILQVLRRAYGGLGGVRCWGGNVGPKTMQLLKAMRAQLGDASASRSVDAVAAAEVLGIGTAAHDFDRRLQDLLRAGYLEPDPNSAAPATRGLCRITFAGLDAADQC